MNFSLSQNNLQKNIKQFRKELLLKHLHR